MSDQARVGQSGMSVEGSVSERDAFRLDDEYLAALNGRTVVARTMDGWPEDGVVADVNENGFYLRTAKHVSWYGRDNAQVEVRDA